MPERSRFEWRLIAVLTVFLVLATASGCSDDVTGASTYVVTYQVFIEQNPQSQDTSGELTRVVYRDEGGNDIEVTDFGSSPEQWATALPMSPGDSFFLRAEASLTDARILAQMGAEPDTGVPVVRTGAMPGYETGPFFLEIPAEPLP